MKSLGLAEVVGADDVWVNDPGSVLRLPQKPFDSYGILGESRAKDLDRGQAAFGVLGTVHRGGAPFPHIFRETVTGDRTSCQRIGVHAVAKLVNLASSS